MTKKFIKSAVILGLASITISMTQPVEAISNRLEYQEQYKRVKEELDALKEKGPKLGERSLYFRLVNKFHKLVWPSLGPTRNQRNRLPVGPHRTSQLLGE